MINYIVIGGGWRAEFYLRIAKLVPEEFTASAICVRNDARAKIIADKYDVKVVSTIEEALKEPFDFIVNCINKDDIWDLSVDLANKGYYVLAETPVIKPVVGDNSYKKIQVAEQFHLKGTYQAIKKIIDSGIVGKVENINISVAHDYHAMSLIRFFLDDYEKPQLLGSVEIGDYLLRTKGRSGELDNKKIVDSCRHLKVYKFKDATAVYDYNGEQYFSPIRKDRLIIRGTRGEIENEQVRYYNDKDEFVCSEIKHISSGLLDGFYNDKIVFENKVLYEYLYKNSRLSEEEEAIAKCLVGMKKYIQTSEELYNFKKAYEDYIFV